MQTLGALWLAHEAYPDVYDYDMAQIATEYFELFFWLFVGTFCLGVFLVVISIIDWKTARSLHNAGFGMSLTVITTFVDLFMIAIFVL